MTLRARGNTQLDVRDYGARGNGSDATKAFARAIDALPRQGGTILVPNGLYLIDPTAFPGAGKSTYGIRFRSNMRLYLGTGATLASKAHDGPRSDLLLMDDDTEQMELAGLGRIIGDRTRHVFAGSSTHEWGHVLRLRRVRHATVRDVTITEATGDGISINGDDIEIHGVTSTHNRRQGLTIGGSSDVKVVDCLFAHTGKMKVGGKMLPGTAPLAGIDIEPDRTDVTNVLLERVRLVGNEGSGLTSNVVAVANPPVIKGVQVKDCHAEGNTGSGFEVIRANDVHFDGGSATGNGWTGVYFASGTSGSIQGMTFARNRLKRGDPAARARASVTGLKASVTGRDIEIKPGAEVKVGANRYE